MRQRNVADTLSALYAASPATMAALQGSTGLSRRTLELIVDELLARGWVTELEPPASARRPAGRPARRFAFAYDAAAIVGIELDAGAVRVVVADLGATVLARLTVALPISSPRDERLGALQESLARLLADAGVSRDSVLAVTVATPGIVQDDGTVDLPMTMPGWTGFSLSDAVGELFDCPVRVENDAKLAAVGEKWFVGDAVQDFVYLFADDDRIGTGVVIRGELHRGQGGAAGEITWAQGLGLHELGSPLLFGLNDPASDRHEEAVALLDASRAGDPDALAEVDSLARKLLPGITAIGWILAPEEIVLGGTLGTAHDVLIPALEKLIRADTHPLQLRLRRSGTEQDAVLVGCLRMSVEAVTARFAEAADLPELAVRAEGTAG